MDNASQQVPPVVNQQPIKTSNNLSFAKALAYGFVIVSIGISIAVGGYLLGTNKTKPQPISKISVVPNLTPIPTVDPTSNWKTYTNTNYGFEFKYPSNVSVSIALHIPPHGTDLVLPNNNFIETDLQITDSKNISVILSIFQKPMQNLEKYVSDEVQSEKDFNIKNSLNDISIAYSQMTINSTHVYKIYYTHPNSSQDPGTRIYFQDSKHVYLLGDNDFYKTDQTNLVSQIISTFKFTDQNQTNTVSYCSQNQLMAETIAEGAAGTMYVNVTIKNISNSACQIIGNNFLVPNFDSSIKNITTSHQKQPATAVFTLASNQIVYSLITYPNGPQCQSPEEQKPISFSYAISPTDSINLKNLDHVTLKENPLYIEDCTSPTDVTNIQIWPLSDTPIK